MSNGPKVGFSGSRKGMSPLQRDTVERLLYALRPLEIHHGDCVGADEEVHKIAWGLSVMPWKPLRIVIHPPDDESQQAMCQGASEVRKPKPYLTRNRNIVAETDLLIAAPATDSRGTAYTMNFARGVGNLVLWVDREGIVHVG